MLREIIRTTESLPSVIVTSMSRAVPTFLVGNMFILTVTVVIMRSGEGFLAVRICALGVILVGWRRDMISPKVASAVINCHKGDCTVRICALAVILT